MNPQMVETPGSGPLARAATVCLRLLIVAAAVVAVALLLGRMPLLVVPVFVALLLTAVLSPVVTWLTRHHWRRGWASITVLLAFLAVVAALFAFIIPQAVQQLQAQSEQVARQLDRGATWLLERLPFDPSQPSDLFSRIGSALTQGATGAVSAISSGVVLVLKLLAGIALTIVLLFFFLRDGREMAGWLFHRLPRSRRDDVAAASTNAYGTLSRWVLGTFIIALADATLIGLGIWLIGVPLVLPLALLTFLGAFIPVVGATVAGAVAVLVALASGGLTDALLTLAVVVGVQQLEGNVLQPVVMGHEVPLHPVTVLLAVTAGGILAGIAGAFIAVPLAAMLSAGGHELRKRYLERHGRAQEV